MLKNRTCRLPSHHPQWCKESQYFRKHIDNCTHCERTMNARTRSLFSTHISCPLPCSCQEALSLASAQFNYRKQNDVEVPPIVFSDKWKWRQVCVPRLSPSSPLVPQHQSFFQTHVICFSKHRSNKNICLLHWKRRLMYFDQFPTDC